MYYCVGDLEDRDLMLMDCNYAGLERDLAAMVPGFTVGEFGCYFVEAPEGELVNVWAICGSVPALSKPLYELVRHGEPGGWTEGYERAERLWIECDLATFGLDTVDSVEYDVGRAGEAMARAMLVEVQRRLPATTVIVVFKAQPAIPTEQHLILEINGVLDLLPDDYPEEFNYLQPVIEAGLSEAWGLDYWDFPRGDVVLLQSVELLGDL